MAGIKDLVLIHYEDEPTTFARIEDIFPDRKKNWYHVKLLFLQLPLRVVTWILKEEYIYGEEFTIEGKRIRLTKIKAPQDDISEPSFKDKKDKESESKSEKIKNKKGNLIYL